jgi:hypothetical protein
MSSKLNRYSLIAAFAITAVSAVARAEPAGGSNPAQAQAGIDVLESGNPHSLDYGIRDVGSRPLTQDELDSLEIGNPDSIDYGNRPIGAHGATNEEIRALESGNPHSVNSR